MSITYNIYCDESCHLEHDHIPIMLFGAVWCPRNKVKDISKQIRQLKTKHNANGEIKWTKLSSGGRIQFYQNLLDYFFAEDNLNFRCLVVVGKDRLNHDYFNQGSHDSFYYKMYYQLLLNVVNKPESHFNIYLDIKDTRGSRKIRELRNILHNKLGDYEHSTISQIQLVRSHESELVQLADFLMGAVAYCNRDDISKNNSAKINIIQKIKTYTRTDLIHSCPPWEEKFNLFIFQPRRLDDEHTA
ncbi:MAG: DUF3800 domain-containing protein [Planctomycetota bacterium]